MYRLLSDVDKEKPSAAYSVAWMTKYRDGNQTGWSEAVVGRCHITFTPKVTLSQKLLWLL